MVAAVYVAAGGRCLAAILALVAVSVTANDVETAFQTQEPLAKAERQSLCVDNVSWADAYGSTCASWQTDNCFDAGDMYDYSEAEQEEILRQCPESCGICHLIKWEESAAASSRVQQFCRQALANDSSCCVDHGKVPRVGRFDIRRPNTEWNCTDDNCWDELKGLRGKDILWVPDTAHCRTARLLYLHGGSWEFGSPVTDGYDVLVPKIARRGSVIVLSLDYPLAPAARHKDMLDHTIAALEYLATHGPPGCENAPSEAPPLLIGGDSAGGGLAYSALLALQSGQRQLHNGRVALAGAFFYSPWLNMRCDTATYHSKAYSATKRLMGGVWHNGDVAYRSTPAESVADGRANALEYLGSPELLDDPIASPFLAGPDLLKGLPPLMFVAASDELVMGDTVIAAQNAAAAGVDVVLDIYDGMWHVFPMYSDGCGSGEPLWLAQRALRRTGRFLRDVAASGHSPCRTKAVAKAVAYLGIPSTQLHIQTLKARDVEQKLKEASSDGFPCEKTLEEVEEMMPPGFSAVNVFTFGSFTFILALWLSRSRYCPGPQR